MDSLDKKVFEVFSGRVVPKGATKMIKDSANVPTYVLEYLLGTYCTSDDEMEIAVQINGKTKAVVSLSAEASREEAIAAGKEAVAGKITGNVVKEIYVPKKIINIVQK